MTRNYRRQNTLLRNAQSLFSFNLLKILHRRPITAVTRPSRLNDAGQARFYASKPKSPSPLYWLYRSLHGGNSGIAIMHGKTLSLILSLLTPHERAHGVASQRNLLCQTAPASIRCQSWPAARSSPTKRRFSAQCKSAPPQVDVVYDHGKTGATERPAVQIERGKVHSRLNWHCKAMAPLRDHSLAMNYGCILDASANA
jgi:hypothetical protein